MKDDAPAPAHPPRKRYQLENEQRTPTIWLHSWASNESLPEPERMRAMAEIERRRAQAPDRPVGLLVDREGVTQLQLAAIEEMLAKSQASIIHHPGVPTRVHSACRRLGVNVCVHTDVRDEHAGLRNVVLNSEVIIAAPRMKDISTVKQRSPAWEAIHYAKHRKLVIKVVLPDGERL